MKRITIDVLEEKAMPLLENLEELQLIRLHKDELQAALPALVETYKGAMRQQPLAEVEQQLKDLRNEWG